MKIITLSGKQFNEYAKKHKYRSYYQTVEYGKLSKLDGYDYHLLGFLNNSNELVGATMILFKKVFLNYKIGYSPYGFLLNYTDSDFIEEMTKKLRILLFKQHFLYLKLNPNIECSRRNKTGNIISYNHEINDIIEILQNNNYIHKGFTNYFEDSKPRWNAVLKLTASNEKLYLKLSKQIRNKINKAEKCGIEIKELEDLNDLNVFYQFIKRKHKKSLKYYETLLKTFDNSKVYMAILNTRKYLKNSQDNYEHDLLENERLNSKLETLSKKRADINKTLTKKMESDKLLEISHKHLLNATKLYSRYQDNIYIAGMLVIEDKDGSNLVIEGFDKKYKDFDPNYLLKWEYIKKINKNSKKYFNMNGIVGEFKGVNKYSGLNEAKLGYGAEAIEYIGEFDLIINKLMLKIYTKRQKKNQS